MNYLTMYSDSLRIYTQEHEPYPLKKDSCSGTHIPYSLRNT